MHNFRMQVRPRLYGVGKKKDTAAGSPGRRIHRSFLALAYSALSTEPPAPPRRVLWESTNAL